MKIFAEQLKKLRKKHNLTQEKLAMKLNFNRTTIANYEQGLRTPSLHTLLELANFFKVSLDTLLGREYIYKNENNMGNTDYENLKSLKDKYLQYFFQDKKERAYHLLLKNLQKGNSSLKEIYFNIIIPSLDHTNFLFKQGEIFQEEMILFKNATKQIVELLYSPPLKKNKKSPMLLAIAPPNEFNHVELKIITNLLELEGWQIYFGANLLSITGIVRIIHENEIKQLLISINREENLLSTENIIDAVRLFEEEEELKIIMTGKVFKKNEKQKKYTKDNLYTAKPARAFNLIKNIFP